MSKFTQFKHFEINSNDSHKTYLRIFNNGDFMLGELFGPEDDRKYHCILAVRGEDVEKIVSLLNDPASWDFGEQDEDNVGTI